MSDADGRREVVARGWATVDLDRATSELAGLLAPDTSFDEAPRSTLLGARCRCARADPAVSGEATWIVLLEPDTEGRLAAFLARHGEGWVATWTAPGSSEAGAPSRASPGPLGDEWLATGPPSAGPFTLRLTTATIEP